MNYRTDIPLSVAIAAHRGTSQSPERRGNEEQTEYSNTLQTDMEALVKYATTDEKRAMLAEEFTRYRTGLQKRWLAYLHAGSRCVSSFIAGPSNFPVRQQNKRMDTQHKRLQEVLEYRKHAVKAIRRKLTPELQPIKSSDSDAVSKLKAKIEKAEKQQALMKACNKVAKSNPKDLNTPAKIQRLRELGLTTENAHRLFEKDFAGRVGFPGYELTNNNANIRRMKQRVEKISRAQATPETETQGTNARLEDCPADNRVRIFFPGKPSAEIRTRLKRAAFRWTPSLGCWQAYRNTRSLEVAHNEAWADKIGKPRPEPKSTE